MKIDFNDNVYWVIFILLIFISYMFGNYCDKEKVLSKDKFYLEACSHNAGKIIDKKFYWNDEIKNEK